MEATTNLDLLMTNTTRNLDLGFESKEKEVQHKNSRKSANQENELDDETKAKQTRLNNQKPKNINKHQIKGKGYHLH
jgi:hypothetical protein